MNKPFSAMKSGTHVHVRKVRSFDSGPIVRLDHELKGYIQETPSSILCVLRYWQGGPDHPDGRRAIGVFTSSLILDVRGNLVRTQNSVYEVTEVPAEEGAPSFEEISGMIARRKPLNDEP